MAQRRGRPYWSWFPSAPFREERKSHVVATVEQLAALVRGRLVGDGSVSIHSARPVGEAGPGDITFIENERYAKMLRTSPASAAIVGPHFKADRRRTSLCRSSRSKTRSWPSSRSAATSATPRSRAGRASIRRPGSRRPPRSAPTSPSIPFVYVGDEAEIGDGATLHPGVVVGDRCRVGADTVIHPNAVLYHDVILGDRVEVHAGDRAGRRRVRLPARSTGGTSRSPRPAASRSATTSRSAPTARSTARRSRRPGSARGRRSTTSS